MDEIVRVKVQYLDHLLKQLIHHKEFKGKQFRDDVPAIAKKLVRDLEEIMQEVTEQITTDPAHTIGEKYFNGRALKSQYEGNWKLRRQLEHLEFVKNRVLDEWAIHVKSDLIDDTTDGILSTYHGSFDGENSQQTGSLSGQQENEEEHKLPERFILSVIDYDKEQLEEENSNLRSAYFVSSELGELQNDINKELLNARENLVKAAQETKSAAVESGQALNEVKKGVRSKWNWLPFKLGALFGTAGGAGGAVLGHLPGLAIGASTGVAGGTILGSTVAASVKQDVDTINPETPSELEENEIWH